MRIVGYGRPVYRLDGPGGCLLPRLYGDTLGLFLPFARGLRYHASGMPDWERFARAPISEAVLDIQVRFTTPVDTARLAEFHRGIEEEYPVREDRVKWHGRIEVGGASVQQAVARAAEGFMFRSADRHRAVQARQDGFTYNWLKPYKAWEDLRDEAKIHWERYRNLFQPEAVTRLGLRYINRIELPLPLSDIRDYIKTAPDIADGMPQAVSSLFMRLEIPDAASGLLAILTETIEAKTADNRLPLIFDIDVVRSATFAPDSTGIWETFEAMRQYKNRIFFMSLSDRAKEMFR